ncbi:MAG: hypothetical protein CR975_02075 [Gammaproteobacteria bacterium]|nr:MAG: hypothetical protein CR975_02075 [Gammaproteobacteria bacterium]
MRKLDALREFMLKSVAELGKHPDKLQVWTDDGKLTFKTLDPAPTHKNRYTISVLVTEWSGPVEALTMPLLNFYKANHGEGDEGEIAFEAEIIDRDRVDVLFKLSMHDKVVGIIDDDGTVIVKPECSPESQVPWFVEKPGQYTLIWDGEEIAKWTTP